jgi:hypothetical protein
MSSCNQGLYLAAFVRLTDQINGKAITESYQRAEDFLMKVAHTAAAQARNSR